MPESTLEGYRCRAQVQPSRVRLWSRAGTEWSERLSELVSLTSLGKVVLDGEVAVVTPTGGPISNCWQPVSTGALQLAFSPGNLLCLRHPRVSAGAKTPTAPPTALPRFSPGCLPFGLSATFCQHSVFRAFSTTPASTLVSFFCFTRPLIWLSLVSRTGLVPGLQLRQPLPREGCSHSRPALTRRQRFASPPRVLQ